MYVAYQKKAQIVRCCSSFCLSLELMKHKIMQVNTSRPQAIGKNSCVSTQTNLCTGQKKYTTIESSTYFIPKNVYKN